MRQHDFPVLDAFLSQWADEVPAFPSCVDTQSELLAFYDDLFSFLESRMWKDGLDAGLLDTYGCLVAELDQQLGRMGDERHGFMVVIPLADRPKHLQTCLESLLGVCRRFPYGQGPDGKMEKISVLIADDSRWPENIAKHQEIADTFSRQGLPVEYFGQQEQVKVLDTLSARQRKELLGVTGEFDADRFYHKGASIMRNITCLKLLQQPAQNTLFYFIDSDQEFCVKIRQGREDKDVYAVNYFYHLDRIFSVQDKVMVTGKVVGDPPVSPAVMAGNLLDDVIAFLQQAASLDERQQCRFHQESKGQSDSAAYHDMAELFGFKHSNSSFDYQCDLEGPHDHRDCMAAFSSKLKRFFDGEHPTRKTYFEYVDVLSSLSPARTVYTGNYVFSKAGLAYFIPFASLKLRMAGPTLGRLLSAQLQDRFASVNLPMLHKRTVDELGQSEFRPGIEHQVTRIDLSGEYERQYYGDVMLFSMVELTRLGYPGETLGRQEVERVLSDTEGKLKEKYTQKRLQVQCKIDELKTLLGDDDCWWNHSSDREMLTSDIWCFIDNLECNFSENSKAVMEISSPEHRQQRLEKMCDAILNFARERQAWVLLTARQ